MSFPEIPGFRLERQLGEGAYGRVYLAHELEGLTRPVALKVFSADGRGAFERELEAMKEVEELRRQGRHPEIVQALGSGEHDGRGWIALEYMEDGSLRDLVERRGPLPWREAVEAIQQATAAVAILHEAGRFHRDVKPANLLVGADGRVRLGDFGLSRTLDASLSAAGSPAFAAPEVIAGQIDPEHRARVDVYGLGATLAYLLTGETARPGKPDAFALERRGTPRPLVDVVLEAMAYEPEERPTDAGTLGMALQGVMNSPRTLPGALEGVGEESEPVKPFAEPTPAPTPRADLAVDVQRPRCPFCHDPVATGDEKQACVECMAWHHAACWKEHGRCAACQSEAAMGSKGSPEPRTRAGRSRTLRKLMAVVVGALTAMFVLGVVFYTRTRDAQRAQLSLTLQNLAQRSGSADRIAKVVSVLKQVEGGTLTTESGDLVRRVAVEALTAQPVEAPSLERLARVALRSDPFAANALGDRWQRLVDGEEVALYPAHQARAQLVMALGELEDSGATDWLLRILDEDPHGAVRFQALRCLRAHRSDATVAQLRQVLLTDPDHDTRGLAAYVLGEWQERLAITDLRSALARDGWLTGYWRQVATKALETAQGPTRAGGVPEWLAAHRIDPLGMGSVRQVLDECLEALQQGAPEDFMEHVWPRGTDNEPAETRPSGFEGKMARLLRDDPAAMQKLAAWLEKNRACAPTAKDGDVEFEAPGLEACRLIWRDQRWYLLLPT